MCTTFYCIKLVEIVCFNCFNQGEPNGLYVIPLYLYKLCGMYKCIEYDLEKTRTPQSAKVCVSCMSMEKGQGHLKVKEKFKTS